MLLRVFGIVFPVFAVVGVGYLYGRWRRPDMAAANELNMVVLLPVLIFSVLSGKEFDLGAYGFLALAGVLVILGSGLLAWPVARLIGLPAKTFVPSMMFINSGNMGLPLAVFAFGEQALPSAVVLFIVANGLHFTLGIWMMDHRAPWLQVLRQPIILATLAGILFALFDWRLPGPVSASFNLLGQASIPLLLFSLGARLTSVDLREWRLGVIGALVCPLTGVLMVLLLLPFLPLSVEQRAVLMVFGALPPAVLNFLVAEQYHQEPTRVAALVLIGNLGALLTIPLVLAYVL